MNIDCLLAGLDEWLVATGHPPRRPYVVGIHEEGTDWWLQISSEAHPAASLLLRIPAGTSATGVLAAVWQWNPLKAPAQTVLTASH